MSPSNPADAHRYSVRRRSFSALSGRRRQPGTAFDSILSGLRRLPPPVGDEDPGLPPTGAQPAA